MSSDRAMMLNRRQLMGLALPGAASLSAQAPQQRPGLKIGMMAGELTDEMLRFTRQLGLEWVDLGSRPKTGVPPPGRLPQGQASPWSEAELLSQKQRVESYGLKIGIKPLHGFPNVVLGTSERDRDIEAVQQSIRLAGKVGIPVLEYNFYLFRASEGYTLEQGRAGVELRAFDLARIKEKSRIAGMPEASREDLWDRLTYFLKAVVPVAERAGVRLALHPNDPPVETFRGAVMPVRSVEDLKRVIEVVPSPANGITLDTGVTAETGADALEAIRYFGSRNRINHVHFRNVRMHEPFTRYTETFVDDGDVDMAAAMRALLDVRYSYLVVPDHTPHLSVDRGGGYAGWAYAIGYIKALEAAARK